MHYAMTPLAFHSAATLTPLPLSATLRRITPPIAICRRFSPPFFATPEHYADYADI